VEVYCLIANDDVSFIKPKSFNVPVITPYELEIGLRARDWESKLAVGLGKKFNKIPSPCQCKH
jgi:diphthamide synthase subunit DPH2